MRYQLSADGRTVIDTRTGQRFAAMSVDDARFIQAQLTRLDRIRS
jgi:hypothetical protein